MTLAYDIYSEVNYSSSRGPPWETAVALPWASSYCYRDVEEVHRTTSVHTKET